MPSSCCSTHLQGIFESVDVVELEPDRGRHIKVGQKSCNVTNDTVSSLAF